MRVKYATQVLSHTVAAAICTVQFDSIFYCLNSSTLHTTKKHKCAINEKTSHIDYLKDSIKFIRNLKVFD